MWVAATSSPEDFHLLSTPVLGAHYARRWRVENGIAEAVKFFHRVLAAHVRGRFGQPCYRAGAGRRRHGREPRALTAARAAVDATMQPGDGYAR